MVLLYYFLIKFANPAIVPWVHTTMFYNLYEDTGLAYLHTEFDEHRAYLEAWFCRGPRARLGRIHGRSAPTVPLFP
jgi:hypothetical protein